MESVLIFDRESILVDDSMKYSTESILVYKGQSPSHNKNDFYIFYTPKPLDIFWKINFLLQNTWDDIFIPKTTSVAP